MSDFTMEIEREQDGRWIGEVADVPGVLERDGWLNVVFAFHANCLLICSLTWHYAE